MKKNIAIPLVILIFCFQGALAPGFGQWLKHTIDEDISTAVSVDAGDLDGDTRLDLLVTDSNHNTLCWYQNKYPYWVKHIIDPGAPMVVFAYCGDMDGDDDLDVAACLYGSGDMVWYENKHPDWTKHIIDSNTGDADFTQVADINGDGKPDVITGPGKRGGALVWYENKHPQWIKHTIEEDVAGMAPVVKVADLNGDGIRDVVATLAAEGKVYLYTTEDKGISWIRHPIDEDLPNAFGLNCGYINGDDVLDLVVTTGGPYYQGKQVLWYENKGAEWVKHEVDSDLSGANCVHVADVDGNGLPDIYATGYKANQVVWYENKNSVWTKHFIDDSFRGPRVFMVADVDGDNSNEVVVPGAGSVAWYKNPFTKTAYGESIEFEPSFVDLNFKDSLGIRAHISNPEDHPILVHAFIRGESSAFMDSLQLYDDGLHRDGLDSDHIYGGLYAFEKAREDLFELSVRTMDAEEHVINYLVDGYFTTIGPIVMEDVEISLQEPDKYKLDYVLHNKASSASVNQIWAELESDDPNIRGIVAFPYNFGTLEAGQSKRYPYSVDIYTQNDPDSVSFNLAMYSDDILFWRDTLFVHLPSVASGVGVIASTSTDSELLQSYPNPFSISTHISYSIARPGLVKLKVSDLYGREIRLLDNEFQQAGTYTLEFNPGELSGGIYVCSLQIDNDPVKTKKMHLLR